MRQITIHLDDYTDLRAYVTTNVAGEVEISDRAILHVNFFDGDRTMNVSGIYATAELAEFDRQLQTAYEAETAKESVMTRKAERRADDWKISHLGGRHDE